MHITLLKSLTSPTKAITASSSGCPLVISGGVSYDQIIGLKLQHYRNGSHSDVMGSYFGGMSCAKKLKKQKFEILYQNVRGLQGKLATTKEVLATLLTTLTALTETRLDESVHGGELSRLGM